MKTKKPSKEKKQKKHMNGDKNDLNKLIEITKKQNEVLNKLLEKINTPKKKEN